MKREAGLDLIRVVGVLFVVSIHHFLYNGFYSKIQTGWLMWAADSFRWLFFCCNGLFMMLTGYLKSPKPFTKGYYKSLIPLLVSYVLCCAIIFPLQHLLLTEKLPFSEWMNKLFGFGNYAWYVEMYIGLILFSPLINLGLGQIKSEKGLCAIAVILFCMTALPGVTPINFVPDYWTSLYPVTYYVLGAVIRRLQPRVKPRQGLGGAMAVCMILGLISILTADKGFSTGYTQGYGGFWPTLTALLVFLGLYRVNIGERAGKVLAWLAGGCYEGFMLSLIPDLWAYGLLKQWHTPEKWPLLYLCVTIPIFIVSLLAGKAVHTLSGKLVSLLPGFRQQDQAKYKTKSGSC